MNSLYEVEIVRTSKPMGRTSQNYSTFDNEVLKFKNKQEVNQYLTNNYGNCKRVRMFVDNKNGQAKQVGLIYCFINQDISHNSPKWYQQDWVSINKVIYSTEVYLP